MVKTGIPSYGFKALKEATFLQEAELTYTKDLAAGAKSYICRAKWPVSEAFALTKIGAIWFGCMEGNLKADAADKVSYATIVIYGTEPTIGSEVASLTSFSEFGLSVLGGTYTEGGTTIVLDLSERTVTATNKLWISLWQGIKNQTAGPLSCTSYIKTLKAAAWVMHSSF